VEIFLENESVEIEKIKFYGSPMMTGLFFILNKNFKGGPRMAFRTTEDPDKVWKSIPLGTDIVITHMPPYGILDNKYGCISLKNRVMEVSPTVHCFGHIHAMNGFKSVEKTTFINCACEWEPLYAPHYFDFFVNE
jgi:Icc-related predicted phosphoesterase